jgi:anti-sigma regulatory factor (Ser/Thr protein kinase)
VSTLIQTIISGLDVAHLSGDDPRIAAAARSYINRMLAGHPLAYDASLVATELVANAQIHSRSGQAGGEISVGVSVNADTVSIQVLDQGAAEQSRVRDRDGIDEYGRGLAVCRALGKVAVADGPDGHFVSVTLSARGAEQ